MKKTVLCLLVSLLSSGLSTARTWTNTDGSKTFEGDLLDYSPETQKVTVQLANGQKMTFARDLLSQKDLDYLESWEPPTSQNPREIQEQLQAQEIGQKLLKTKLHRFTGRRYKRAELESAPEYYLLYFSASW